MSKCKESKGRDYEHTAPGSRPRTFTEAEEISIVNMALRLQATYEKIDEGMVIAIAASIVGASDRTLEQKQASLQRVF